MQIKTIPQHGTQPTRFGLVNCFLVREAGDALFGMSHLGITGWSPWWCPLNKC